MSDQECSSPSVGQAHPAPRIFNPPQLRRKVTARLLPQFVGHDAFDHCRIAVLFDEELAHATL